MWWSECPPCRVEQPDLNEAAAELGDTVVFLGLNIRDSGVEKAQAFVRNYDVPYPSVYAPDGPALLSFAGTLNPRSIPSTVVLDRQGRVAASVQGRIPRSTPPSPSKWSPVSDRVPRHGGLRVPALPW